MALFSYVLVLMVWSTTPLAIKLSNDSVSPVASLGLRMALAVVLGLILLRFGGRYLNVDRAHLKIYLAGSFGVFPNMAFVYYAAQHISSGLIAVLFGLTPVFTGVAAHFVLKENLFSPRKVLALSMAVGGLLTIYMGQLAVGENGSLGVLLMVCSTLVFSLSTVWVKHYSQQLDVQPMDQTVGVMMFALPGILLAWLLLDGDTAIHISATSLWAILYLTVVGSLVGFLAFFHVLNTLGVGPVSLIPLITPVFALMLGKLAAGEVISLSIVVGAAMILVALVLYENLLRFTVSDQQQS